jgi:subtilase family serine protease
MNRVRFPALAAAGAAALTLASASVASATAPARVTLRNSQSPAAATTPRTGDVASATAMNFEVELKLADQAGAQSLAQAVSTPGNASYGKFLTPAQWEAQYSPSAADVDQVKQFLTQSGFTVNSVSADRMAVEASGTAAQVEQAFGTSLSMHQVDGDSLVLADQNLSVPSSIAAIVGGVSGVSDTMAKPDDTVGGPATTSSTAPAAGNPNKPPFPPSPGFRVAPPCGQYYNQIFDTTLPQFPGGPSKPPWVVCGYTGAQYRSAYGLSDANTGRGVTVAVVDAYLSPTLFADAHQFAQMTDPSNPFKAGQFETQAPANFNKGGPNKCDAPGWFGEQTLDVEAVHDVAPGATVLAAAAKNCDSTQLNKALRNVIDQHSAQVVSNSYGDDGGDVLDTAGDREATDNILLMAAATGVTVAFSSGDDGDEFTTIGQVAADYPASSPYATAVGGTSLEVGQSGQRLGEFGWSTARSFLCNDTLVSEDGCTAAQEGQWLPIDLALDGGSGGGTSVVYPQPFYQQGVVPNSLSEVNGNTPMRVVPDISMDGDPGTGMLVGQTQQFPEGVSFDVYRIGGTSVSSPLFAGVVARADQARGASVGFVNPALYGLSGKASALLDVGPAGNQAQSRSDFANDVDNTDGLLFTHRIIGYEGPEQFCTKKGVCTTRQVALHATRGYDNMTGLGAPGATFVRSLSGH